MSKRDGNTQLKNRRPKRVLPSGHTGCLSFFVSAIPSRFAFLGEFRYPADLTGCLRRIVFPHRMMMATPHGFAASLGRSEWPGRKAWIKVTDGLLRSGRGAIGVGPISTADLKVDVRSPTMEVWGSTIGNSRITSRFPADRCQGIGVRGDANWTSETVKRTVTHGLAPKTL